MAPASIPSPSSGTIDIGPLSLTAYGLMIALGVLAAVWLFGRRIEARRIGTQDDSGSIAIWAVLAGLIGARAYHVITDWATYEDNIGDAFKVWDGGLGIPGGIIAGTAVGLWRFQRRGIPLALGATCAAPALPLAQAIGRWGNYFNQELYGKPTDLPWGLEIDADNFVTADPPGTTFHPTFLYESLWNLGLCGGLLWLDRRVRLAPGALFGIYIMGYGVGRFWVEGLRVDPADHIAGLRWNQWMALIFVAAGAVIVVLLQRASMTAVAPDGAALDADVGAGDEEIDTDVVDELDVEDTDMDDASDVDADTDVNDSRDPSDIEAANADDETVSSPGGDRSTSRRGARRRGGRPD